jgi:hypothetical protein
MKSSSSNTATSRPRAKPRRQTFGDKLAKQANGGDLPNFRIIHPQPDPPASGNVGEQFVKRVFVGEVQATLATSASTVGPNATITPNALAETGLLDLDYLFVEKVEVWCMEADKIVLTADPALATSVLDALTYTDYGTITESARVGFSVPSEIAQQVRGSTGIATVAVGYRKLSGTVTTGPTTTRVNIRLTVWCRV